MTELAFRSKTASSLVYTYVCIIISRGIERGKGGQKNEDTKSKERRDEETKRRKDEERRYEEQRYGEHLLLHIYISYHIREISTVYTVPPNQSINQQIPITRRFGPIYSTLLARLFECSHAPLEVRLVFSRYIVFSSLVPSPDQ